MRWTATALVLALLACSGPSTVTKNTPPTFESDRALLTIPVPPDARAALQRMESRGSRGNIAAAWARAHYLIDVFDDARFRRDDTSLQFLAETIAPGTPNPTERGGAATERALEFLLLQVDGVLAANREHAGAQAARTLLEFDAQPPTARHQLFQRMLELKAVARSTQLLADNAVLRLVGFCRQALTDATTSAWSKRMRVVAHCLYPLYDSDPDPYFDDDPAARPPPPGVGDLLADLEHLLVPVAERRGRLEFAAGYLIEQLVAFASAGATELPVVPERGSLGMPTVDSAPPYDWTPVLAIGDGSEQPSVDELAQVLDAEVQGDGRATVAVAASAKAPASALFTAAEAAIAVGATRLELIVWTEQMLTVPKGDYWHDRIDGEWAPRLAVIPLSLAVLSGAGAQRPSGPDAQQRWDPDRATLGVHLVVGRAEWRLIAPTGEIAVIDAADASSPEHGLREQLDRLRKAFGSEDAIIVVPGEGATAGMIVAAAAASYRDDRGHVLFSRIALASSATVATSASIATRIANRHKAVVAIEPEVLATRTTVVRACYQDILESAPKTSALINVTLRGDDVVASGRNITAALRACAVNGLGPLMKVREVAAATVELRPQ